VRRAEKVQDVVFKPTPECKGFERFLPGLGLVDIDLLAGVDFTVFAHVVDL
jgi:hypothetical protein